MPLTLKQLHSWHVTPIEAKAIQQELAKKIVRSDRFSAIKTIAGVDVGFEEQGRITRAAVVVLSFPDLKLLEQTIARSPTRFPYVPGLLSFREVPGILTALEKLRIVPDLLMCDGQGIAHPRRLGIASHLGLLTDIPSIGVAKTLLLGHHAQAPNEPGQWTPLYHEHEIIGAVLRTKKRVKPLYISLGHRIGLASALNYVNACLRRYRLPEPTRLADRLASHTDDIESR